MHNIGKIDCCNYSHVGRIYNVGTNNLLVFADECCMCGNAILEIKSKTPDGTYTTTLRRTGKAAERLFEKYGLSKTDYEYRVFSGTKAKEYSFCNIRGQIYNDNGVHIAPQDKFLKMDRIEINTILNRRFYKPAKIKIK